MTVPALELTRVSREFGGIRALYDVSLTVPQRSLTAVIGPNGAGKTTLFNAITNITPPTQGQVDFWGISLRGRSPEEIAKLGLIRTFQSARVFPGMTVLENVMAGACRQLRTHPLMQMLWLAGSEERRVRQQAEAFLELAGLLRSLHTAATDLPAGAQKLVEVMRALMARPRLLLLDEPAAGLNDAETEELGAVLDSIRGSGVTMLVVEHNMSLVMNVADRVIVLDVGAIIACGPPAEVQRNARVIEAYLGRPEVAR